MSGERSNNPQAGPAAGTHRWEPKRGELAYDTRSDRLGVVVAVPKDTGTRLYHLSPEGGGETWTARSEALRPHPGAAEDGTTLDEAVMPPKRERPPEVQQ
ncbi:hypothetical protein [Streptomyces sp. WMMB303]|uniref:hypothetical protein n=1 Tax=Streptomyces sp. WMMB303 TaxID=3034154 RepID=UPI0023EB473F|nr:hypothetical protein [Streptomyces sp. WMMB303]MDF4254515.1 hypothetical protein [Streptomyces sp. WMMB303]